METESYTLKETNPALKFVSEIILVVWAIINLFPIYFMFTFALKSNEEIFGSNVIGLPKEWLWSNFTTAMGTGIMGLYFLNSILVTTIAIAISIMSAMMACYAITRIKWKGAKLTNAFFMLGLTIPIQASIVPVYVVLSNLHWLNKYSTLIVPYAAFSLSMAILICTGFMSEIPYALDEAARIEFMFANVFISDSVHRTLPVGIKALSGQHTTDWGPIGAALVIATFPTLIAYLFLSKKIQASFIAGAVKG